MNLGGISPGSLLLIFLIIVLLFGTKKLRSIGEDLGHAFKGFKKGLNDTDVVISNDGDNSKVEDLKKKDEK